MSCPSAPLISSTVYPGQISSTAININFGESDPEQGRFDHYLLTFSGNNKNFSKRIEMNQESVHFMGRIKRRIQEVADFHKAHPGEDVRLPVVHGLQGGQEPGRHGVRHHL